MKNWIVRAIAVWCIAGLGLLLTPMPAKAAVSTAGTMKDGVRQFQLYATDGYLTLPDGEKVYIWGYSLENKKGTAVYPAPSLEMEEGDRVAVTLTNIGPLKEGIKRVAHTIHWHGLDTGQANDGVPHTSPAIQVGESFTYQFEATHAGTYFYHCHVDTIEHLQMGMHGSLIVKAKGGVKQAWTGGPAYDKEYVFHLNEIDPVWHKAVEKGLAYDKTDFHPRYWTINGKAFPDLMEDPDSTIEGKVGETVLVRLINAGYEEHPFHLHGHHFQVIATDGRPLPVPYEKDTINIGSGERYDILIKFTQSGEFPFHSHKIVDNTNNGVYPGGLHTMTSVKAASSGNGPVGAKTITMKAGEPNVTVNGQNVVLDVAPLLIDGTTFVPLRFIGNQFGAGIEWIDSERSVVYTLGTTRIQLWIDSTRAVVSGETIVLENPPVIVEGSSMVPLRFVSEKLGAALEYDDVTRLITIRYGSGAGQSEAVGGQGSHGSHGGGSGSAGAGGNAPAQGSGAATDSASAAEPGKTVVSIGASAFSVNELRIKKGTAVTWVNDDTQIHTVTSLDGSFDSKNMIPKMSWSYTFDKAGTYIYYCATHPSMEAKVIVE